MRLQTDDWDEAALKAKVVARKLMALGEEDEECDVETVSEVMQLTDEEAWANDPISKLPVLSLGVFEGERSKAKAMARELALLWDIPEELEETISNGSNESFKKGNKQKRNNKKDNQRRRRRSVSQDMDFFF